MKKFALLVTCVFASTAAFAQAPAPATAKDEKKPVAAEVKKDEIKPAVASATEAKPTDSKAPVHKTAAKAKPAKTATTTAPVKDAVKPEVKPEVKKEEPAK